MWEKCGMSRNKHGLKSAISEIIHLRKEFYRNVKIPGSNSGYNDLTLNATARGHMTSQDYLIVAVLNHEYDF